MTSIRDAVKTALDTTLRQTAPFTLLNFSKLPLFAPFRRMTKIPTLIGAVNGYAHGAERSDRRQTILAFQKTGDRGRAFSQRTQHDRAMRNGFIAGNPDAPAQTTAGFGDKSEFGDDGHVQSR